MIMLKGWDDPKLEVKYRTLPIVHPMSIPNDLSENTFLSFSHSGVCPLPHQISFFDCIVL